MVDLPIQQFSFYFILLVKLYKSKWCHLNPDVFVPVKNTCCYLDPTFWPLNFIISFASSSSTVDSSKHQKGKEIHHTFTIGLNATCWMHLFVALLRIEASGARGFLSPGCLDLLRACAQRATQTDRLAGGFGSDRWSVGESPGDGLTICNGRRSNLLSA
jgi:hypothetical protein